jgi:hypothetical protein
LSSSRPNVSRRRPKNQHLGRLSDTLGRLRGHPGLTSDSLDLLRGHPGLLSDSLGLLSDNLGLLHYNIKKSHKNFLDILACHENR